MTLGVTVDSPLGLSPDSSYRLLFVCMANQCRSPIAAGAFRQCLQELGEQGVVTGTWQVESAGTWAVPGCPIHREMWAAAQSLGLDTGYHSSCTIEEMEPLTSFDLILTMEQGQKEALRVEFLSIAQRVYLLSEMAGIAYSVPDPIGGTMEDYRSSVREITRLVRDGLPRIFELVLKEHHV